MYIYVCVCTYYRINQLMMRKTVALCIFHLFKDKDDFRYGFPLAGIRINNQSIMLDNN